jgi:hypothetical protein
MEEPDKLRLFVRVNKKEVAMAQLSAAIYLWFNGGDPISIHTLAAAAHDCFHAMATLKGKESILRGWIAKQSKGLQKRIADAQNFFKHGRKDLKGEALYSPIHGEMLMFDCIVCYGMAFDHKSTPPLLRLYAVRYGLENADVLETDLSRFFLEREVIEELAPLNREEFYERGFALLAKRR